MVALADHAVRRRGSKLSLRQVQLNPNPNPHLDPAMTLIALTHPDHTPTPDCILYVLRSTLVGRLRPSLDC